MRILGTVIESYQQEFGTFPASEQPLRPLSDVLQTAPARYERQRPPRDPWGRPYLYRSNQWSYQVVSFGADGEPDHDYGASLVGVGALLDVTDSNDANGDLVLFDGRFVQRPFGERALEFRTINVINVIFRAAASFAVDNNHYPGASTALVPVDELSSELVPVYVGELPTMDAWGRPLLYYSDGESFYLASFGADGEPDRSYYFDLPCGLFGYGESPSTKITADIVQGCGQFIAWPTGTEP